MPWAGKWSLVPTFFLLPDDGSFGLFHVVSGWTGGSAAGQVVATAGGSRVASKIACQGSFHGLPCLLTWGSTERPKRTKPVARTATVR